MSLTKSILQLQQIGGAIAFWYEDNDTKLIVKLKDSTRAEILDYWVDEIKVDQAAWEDVLSQQIERFVREW